MEHIANRGLTVDGMRNLSTWKNSIRQNHHWNFGTNLTETSLTLFGRGFLGIQTFLPIFVSQFTESKILIGLVSVAIPVGFLLPQLFIAPLVESRHPKKPIVLRLALVEKSLYISLAVLAFNSGNLPVSILVSSFVISCLLIGLAGGATQIVWSELMASVFLSGIRGKYFGTAFFVGGLLSAIGAYCGGVILSQYEFPHNYALTFFIGFCLTIASWFFLLGIREPSIPEHTLVRSTQRDFFRGLPNILRQDRRFSTFLIAQTFIFLGGMALAFVAVWGKIRLTLDGYQLGVLGTNLLIGGTLGSLVSGWLGDIYSHRRLLMAGAGFQILGFALSLWASNTQILFLGMFLLGWSSSSMRVNIQPLVYEYASPRRRPTYIGISSTTFGIAGMVAPFIGGLIAQFFEYDALFMISIALSIIAIFIYWSFVEEPSGRADALG
ncbi:MAG: MFS transporter [Anaerolineales bacterium]